MPLQIKCPDNVRICIKFHASKLKVCSDTRFKTVVVHRNNDDAAGTAFRFVSTSVTEAQYEASKHLLENLTQLDANDMEAVFRAMWIEHTQVYFILGL